MARGWGAVQANWQLIVTVVLSTLLLAWPVARLVRRLIAGAFRGFDGGILGAGSPPLRRFLRIVFATTLLLVAALMLVPALDFAGLRPGVGADGREIADWLLGPGLRVVLTALVAYILRRGTAMLVQRFERVVTGGIADDGERAKRARTLGTVVEKAATGLIFGTAGVMMLNEVGVNVGPVLTGAGIAGIALGLGAQALVRDVLSGFFIILEDQVRVGDAATINGTLGTVEHLNLRTIVLRDILGTIHVFPNGAVDTLANHSRDFSRCVVAINISYDEDPDRVAGIVADVGRELANDPRFGPDILEPAEVLAVDGFADWSMQLTVRVKTIPQKQHALERELRKRLRRALKRHGIDVPYPFDASRFAH
jgi:small conductance mechanosensitive channel